MSNENYYVQSPNTGNVYQVDATKRTNMVAKGYRDVTDEHRGRSAAQPAPRRPQPPTSPPPPAPPAGDTQSTAEGKTT